MAVDEFLLDRLRHSLSDKNVDWSEKKMFGGVCFMVDEKMCFGTFRDGLMIRVNPEKVPEFLESDHSEQMMQRDRPMKGYLMVNADGYDAEDDLDYWVKQCLDWNPFANKSKKRR